VFLSIVKFLGLFSCSSREESREFAKRTDENFKTILDKYGEISEKLSKIMEALIDESIKTRDARAPHEVLKRNKRKPLNCPTASKRSNRETNPT